MADYRTGAARMLGDRPISDDTKTRSRAARVTHNGNVLELCSYADPIERQAAEREAKRILEAGGTLADVRRTVADVRRVRPITNERDRWIWLSEWLSPDRHATPEELLMLAVLERTMFDLRGVDRQARNEARMWVELEDRSHPYGFGSICDVLGRNVDEVRRALAGGTARPDAPMTPGRDRDVAGRREEAAHSRPNEQYHESAV